MTAVHIISRAAPPLEIVLRNTKVTRRDSNPRPLDNEAFGQPQSYNDFEVKRHFLWGVDLSGQQQSRNKTFNGLD